MLENGTMLKYKWFNKKKTKLKNVTQRFDVSNIILKSEKW